VTGRAGKWQSSIVLLKRMASDQMETALPYPACLFPFYASHSFIPFSKVQLMTGASFRNINCSIQKENNILSFIQSIQVENNILSFIQSIQIEMNFISFIRSIQIEIDIISFIRWIQIDII
jgi:hypothetical protein